ncbi:ABC transporter permease [Yaniella flava]|uniref:ABC transporter permease n=1 Tax=Yaniella flava TaxID=287930 RepID=A0ABN2U1F4_9MICC
MFVGLREIGAAKGRFTLMGAVVAMITLLLVMLTGLTGGLGAQNTSALEDLDPQQYVFGNALNDDAPEEPSFAESSVTEADQHAWADTDGVDNAVPVGMTQTLLTGESSGSVAVWGIPEGSGLVEDTASEALSGTTEPDADGVVVSESIAEEQALQVGDDVTIGPVELAVQGVVEDQWYSHSGVVWVTTESWQGISHAQQDVIGTVLAVFGDENADAWDDAAQSTGTVNTGVSESFQALPAYSSENGSLTMMQGFLYAISALVIVSFVTVWTIQRTRDLAVLRALGAATGYLLKDSLGQAAVILAIGVVAGAGVGAGLGALAAGAVPVSLSALTVVGPAVGIWVLGVLGSALAVRRVSKVDPLLALGGN